MFKKNRSINSYKEITYPLTAYGIDIKKIIFPYSFFEVQIILNKNTLPESLPEFIKKCQSLNLKGFVIGIKMHKNSDNYLSFAGDGVSININQIFSKGVALYIFLVYHIIIIIIIFHHFPLSSIIIVISSFSFTILNFKIFKFI